LALWPLAGGRIGERACGVDFVTSSTLTAFLNEFRLIELLYACYTLDNILYH
jgi:hypothetical protein